MGGVDKGLQAFHGVPLALHALTRLQEQLGGPLAQTVINANRNLSAYDNFGVPVWPDTLEDFAGPLAGFLTGLERCKTPYLLTVPCDSPRYPLDLVQRLASAFDDPTTEIAMVTAADEEGSQRPQPVFCLMKVELRQSLGEFTSSGGRKIGQWARQHRTVMVAFDLPSDDPLAFANANTLSDLQALEKP